MASLQESINAALAASAPLTALVSDRIYPGEIPDDEATTPWLFYSVPEETPVDDLDDSGSVSAQFEFHALADTYAAAKAVIEAVKGTLEAMQGGQVTQAFWRGTSDESTEVGYHLVARFDVWGQLANIYATANATGSIVTGASSIVMTVAGEVLTLDATGLTLSSPGQFNGIGAGLTSIDASQLFGTINESRLPSSVALKWFANVFTDGPQTIQPALDTNKGLIVRAHSGTQSANLFEVQDSSGVGQVRMTAGRIGIGQDPTFAVDVKQAKGDEGGLVLRTAGYQASNEGSFAISAWNSAGLAHFKTVNPNGLSFFVYTSVAGNGCHAQFTDGQLFVYNDNPAALAQTILLGQKSSTTGQRSTFSITTPWATSTDASRKARAVFNVFDTAAREAMRIEASGTAPMIGFLGAAASARPTISGSRGGNAALASLLTALATLGLITDSTTA